jgi:hypothetical protein
MGKIFSSLFGGGESKPVKPPTEKSGAQKQAELAKQRQGRGLAATDLSGMRQMIGAYQSGKTTLGAG